VPDDQALPEPQPSRRLHRIAWGADIERDLPGARYGLVLVLLLLTFVFMASGFVAAWVPLVTVALQGATLLAALAAAESSRRLVRFAVVVVVVGLASGIASLLTDTSNSRGLTSILSFLLVGVAPVAIAGSMYRRRKVDVHTVLGAICIYVFIGMFFAFLFTTIGELGSEPFFAQMKTATTADYLYFSFVTLTTVGYGDLSAATGVGRATAVFDALLGQIYLVTVLALLVSQLGRGRGARHTDS
jgi:voltage-gated potassium channel